ncbi:DUF308 domain-containing protein [bacterium]|nr:DUF308 domain-containing protein [bacterium]
MKKLKKVLADNQNAIVIALAELVVGILLLVNATQFTRVIFIILGVFLLVKAIGSGWRYFHLSAKEAAATQTLSIGLIALILGVVCIARSQWFVDTLPAMTLLYGLMILLTASPKVQWTVDAARVRSPRWFVPAVSALVALVCGAVVLAGTLSHDATWVFTGVSLIIGAVLDVATIVVIQRAIAGAGTPAGAADVAGDKAAGDGASGNVAGDKAPGTGAATGEAAATAPATGEAAATAPAAGPGAATTAEATKAGADATPVQKATAGEKAGLGDAPVTSAR